MNRGAKSRWNFWCFLLNFQRYSLTVWAVVVLLFDFAGATPPSRGLQSGNNNLGTLQRYLEVPPEQRKKAVSVIGF